MTINQEPKGTTYEEVLQWASSFLKAEGQEAHGAEWLLKEQMNWTTTQLLTSRKSEMPLSEWKKYKDGIRKASEGIPVQHIIGHEWFFGRKFKVTSDTLIPRPETEEWLNQYLSRLPDKPLTVLDIGTGSGVLAITHKLERPNDRVIAVDISPKALAVAEENAARLKADVTFKTSDLAQSVREKVDVVVSNPPYISADEIEVMDASVINHEPHLALFAEEEGLEIYKRLARELTAVMKPECWLILEYGYRQKNQVESIFTEAFPQAHIEMWKDMSSNDRALYLFKEEVTHED